MGKGHAEMAQPFVGIEHKIKVKYTPKFGNARGLDELTSCQCYSFPLGFYIRKN